MKLKLPSGEFAAYLFDCDGTIADSMPLHYQAWCAALKEWGGEFTEELFYAWAGIPISKTVEMLNEKYDLSMPVTKVVERREQIYYDLLPEIRPVRSVLLHIEEKSGKIPFAVVSGSPRASVLKTLNTLKLLDHFQIIIGAEDYTHGKPHPEPFLLAASRLGVSPEKCLVFEDGDLGIESARQAGMSWVKVYPE